MNVEALVFIVAPVLIINLIITVRSTKLELLVLMWKLRNSSVKSMRPLRQ